MRKLLPFLFAIFLAATCALASAAQTFQNPSFIPTPTTPGKMFHGDLNGDGNDDILYVDAGNASLHVLLGDGHGAFTAGQIITTPQVTAGQCVLRDFNLDHKLDLACASQGSSGTAVQNPIYLYFGNGDGTFAAPQILLMPYGVYTSVTLYDPGDLNGDGYPDLLASVKSTSTYVQVPLLSDTHGHFTIGPLTTSSYVSNPPIAFADVNGDGFADALYSGPGVALGKGDGTFGNTYTYTPAGLNTYGCTFADMDADNHLDAVCGFTDTLSGYPHYIITVQHGNTDGSFATTPIVKLVYGDAKSGGEGEGSFAAPYAVADFNGDGIPDILGFGVDGATIYYGKPNLQFAAPAHFASGYQNATFTPGYILVADVNGDKLPDVLVNATGGLNLSLATANSTLNTARAFEANGVIGYAAVADFNGDGIPDVVATGDLHMAISLGRGDGTFAPYTNLDTGAVHWEGLYQHPDDNILVHGDFNGDGNQDLLGVGAEDQGSFNEFYYYLQGNGDGTFKPPVKALNAGGLIYLSGRLRVADLNGDHRDDVMAEPDTYSGTITAQLSNGDGTFKAVVGAVPMEHDANGYNLPETLPAFADFDGDGKLDVVVAARAAAYVLKGKGDGTFANAITLPIPPAPGADSSSEARSVITGDFDGDGFKDIAVLWGGYTAGGSPLVNANGEIVVFYGKGDGTFSAPVVANTNSSGYAFVDAADLNKDGRDELIVYASGTLNGGTAMGVLRGSAARTFGAITAYTAGTGLANLQIADLNGDGFPELIFSNEDYNIAANSVTVLLNLGNKPAVTGTLSASPEPSFQGNPYTLTAALLPPDSSSLSGSVNFTIDGAAAGSAAISNNAASIAIPAGAASFTAAGTHILAATWAGNATFDPVTVTGSHTVTAIATGTAVTSSLNPSNAGQSITFTANVGSGSNYTGPFTGSVTFTDGSTTLATVPLSSIAANMNGAIFTTSTLAIGTHNITATFTSTSAYGGSSATVTQLVRNPTPPTGSVSVSPEPGVVEQDNLVFTATLVPPANEPNAAYTGTILFTIDGANAGSGSLGSGGLTATYTDTSIHASGTHTISAVYSGDTVHAAATFTGTHVITTLPIAPTITAAVNPIVQGQIATLSTAFNPAYAPKSYVFSLQPQGTLSYYDGGVLVEQVAQPSPTRSSVQLTGLAPGKHIITVSYSGDTYFSPGTSQPLPLTVQASVSLTLTASLPAVQAGKPDIFTVTLTPVGTSTAGTPTGTVTYFADGNQIGTVAVTNGLTTLSSSNLSVGPHAITCLYSGDTNYAQATCTPLNITVTAAPTALALTATPNPSVALTQVMLTATLTSNGLPSQGAINFAVDGVAVFTANAGSNGVASLPYAALTAGPHTISATYAATANYTGSTAQFTETVTPVITSTVLQAQPNPAQQGQTITMAATIAPLGAGSTGAGFSGSVQFYDGPNLIGTTAIQVVPGLTPQFAPFTINTLAPGTHSLQAVFVSTSPSFLGSTSAPLSLTVNPSDLNLSTTSPTLTLQTEHHGDLGVTLTSIGGLTGRFTLTCGTLPYPASCSWAGASVYLPGGGSVTTSLHIDTDIVLGFKSSLDPQDAPQRPGSRLAETLTLAALLPLGLLVFTRRKRLPPLAALAVMLLVATSLTGCGDKYPDHVAPGTYAIQITATGTPPGASTTITKTATFKLVVTQ